MTPAPVPAPSDALIRRVLAETRTIAMVGASANPTRPSYYVMSYLQSKGYRVIPVNPAAAGQTILGETVRAGLDAVEVPIDMVDVFRAPEHAPAITADAIRIGAKTVWLQLGVVSPEAAALGAAAGLTVIMDRCPKIEFARLHHEIGTGGINSGVLTSRRPPLRRRRGWAEAAS